MEEAADQTVVVLWSHKAEPDVFIIQKRKRRTVADHHFLPDGAVKQILRGEIFAQDAHQNKVGTWIVYFEVRILIKKLTQAGALGGDQRFGLFDVGAVGEHCLTGDDSKRIDCPRILARIDGLDQIAVACDGVSKTQPRSGKELGGAAENHDVVIIICQRNCREFCHIIGEFHVSLIYHDIDVVLLADV